MKFKITVMTQFNLLPKDLENYDPKISYEVEVSGLNTVADFCSKLTEVIGLRNYKCEAEFYRKWFNEGKKLERDVRIEQGETVYAVITIKKKDLNEVDCDVYKKFISFVDKTVDKVCHDIFKPPPET